MSSSSSASTKTELETVVNWPLIVSFALRELTGQNAGYSSADWYELLCMEGSADH